MDWCLEAALGSTTQGTHEMEAATHGNRMREWRVDRRDGAEPAVDSGGAEEDGAMAWRERGRRPAIYLPGRPDGLGCFFPCLPTLGFRP